ncbi:hypothetical protein DXG03_002023, partial [Asterophora parasitica]
MKYSQALLVACIGGTALVAAAPAASQNAPAALIARTPDYSLIPPTHKQQPSRPSHVGNHAEHRKEPKQPTTQAQRNAEAENRKKHTANKFAPRSTPSTSGSSSPPSSTDSLPRHGGKGKGHKGKGHKGKGRKGKDRKGKGRKGKDHKGKGRKGKGRKGKDE